MEYLVIAALVAFALTAFGVVHLDGLADRRAHLISRARPRPEIGTPYRGPLYNRHGREIGESN